MFVYTVACLTDSETKHAQKLEITDRTVGHAVDGRIAVIARIPGNRNVRLLLRDLRGSVSSSDGILNSVFELVGAQNEQFGPASGRHQYVILVLALLARPVAESRSAVAVLLVPLPFALVLEAVRTLHHAESRTLVVLPFA